MLLRARTYTGQGVDPFTMKIAYLWHGNPYHDDGILKKIRSQADAWTASGATVGIFCLSSDDPSATSAPLEPVGEVVHYRNPFVGRLIATTRLCRAVGRWAPDVVYLRYTPLFPPPVRLLRAIPTVIEINSDDRAEYLSKSRNKAVLNDVSRRILFAHAKGFACVTPELADRVAPKSEQVRKVVISNGISLGRAQPLTPATNERPRLVYMGAWAPWHGVDKIIALADALPEFDFDFIGFEPPIHRVLPSNIRTHGFCHQQQYESILADSDVAVGTLALHRLGMSQATPLKTREYLLWGLPIVIGYDDPDFRDKPWFLLQLPNTERNVAESVAAIRAFVHAVAGRRVAREAVADRIDLGVKETQRLSFLREVVAG